MGTVAYCSPFVPVEWLAAHGLRPVWLRPRLRSFAREAGSDQAAGDNGRALDAQVPGRRGSAPWRRRSWMRCRQGRRHPGWC